jgi:YfiH family protein
LGVALEAMKIQTIEMGRFLWRETDEVTYVEPAMLSGHSQLRCAFTTRHAGRSGQPLNLSLDRGVHADVLANRQRLLGALGLGPTSLCTVRQVHGNQVCIVDVQTLRRGLDGIRADALMTTLPDVPLGVLVADCLPIVLYSLQPRVLALVHAGRLGTYHRIVSVVLDIMYTRFAVPSQHVYAICGPGIGACCYRLDERAVAPFRDRFSDWEEFFLPLGQGYWTMSLTRANEAQLCAAGVPAAHVQAAHICTVCHCEHFYSHRAEGREAGRGMGVAVMLSSLVPPNRSASIEL